MKPDDDPWGNLATLPEPKLAADFARRVLRQARRRRWRRQVRRRLIAACVFSAALGFFATTLLRVRLAQKNSPAQLNAAVIPSAGAAPESGWKPLDVVAEKPETPAIDNFVPNGRLAADAAAGNARGSRKLAVDSSSSHASQTLVLQGPANSEEQATGAPDQTVTADPPQPSALKSPRSQSGGRPTATNADTAGVRQPSIHLP